MIKLLIGGSPCTYWSIAQKNNRETEPSGMGWELFKNYLIAKEKFNPDFFLYENNKSADEAIKRQIREELNVWDGTFFMQDSGARYIEINSALVSAQNRQRFYVHNCGEIEQPKDRGILLKDILESGQGWTDKSYAIPKTIERALSKLCDKYGYIPEMFNAYNCAEITDKSTTLSTGSMDTSSCAVSIFEKTNKPVYEVRDGKITIKGKEYPIKLKDGFYIIRKLTVTECCRLQTMPDDYCRAVSNSQAYKGLGNGWTAEVIIHILSRVLKNIPKDEKIVVLSMYDGIGTGRYVLDKMGFTNVRYYAYEIDKYAMKIALSNYPDIIEHGDAFQVRNKDWKL